MNYDMNKDLLPIGSIVKIRFSKMEFMIFGYYIKDKESEEVYDYVAITYPWGLLNLNDMAVFDRDLVKKVIHMGYVNEEEIKFKKELKEDKEKGKTPDPLEFIDL